MRIAYNPLYKPDGKTKVGALTSAPINDIVFDLPGKSIWAKGLKFLGTDSLKIIIGSSSDTVAGTWTGQHNEIGRYEDGLTIIYIPKVVGASTTTLNINGLGAKTCYYSGNSKLTTHYPAGTPILFTYYNNGWRRADYDSNTNYYRPIEVNDSSLLGNNNYVLNFKSDGNISYATTAATSTSKQADLTIGINILNLKNNLGVSTIINNASTNDLLPTSKSVYDFVGTYLTSYMHWKGNTPSSGTTFTIPNAAVVGDAYRIAVAGTIPAANSITGSAQVVEVGDIIICTDTTGPKYTVVQTNWTTVAGTSTLAWNSEVTLATIGGLAIKAKLPVNPTLALKSISFTKADGTAVSYNGSSAVDLTGGINYAALANLVRNNLIIKLNGGTTEETNLFTYNGSAAKTVNITPASIGAATSGHTHTTTIAASTDTNQIALVYGGRYKLTAGGTSYVFTMPTSDNTWRPIGTGATDAAAGNHVHKNLIIKWGAGDTEGTNLFTYNGSTAKTINLSVPFSLLFTSFGNVDTGFKATNITATISGVTKSFSVNWAIYAGRSQTADKWTTTRTFTIGNTGKSIDGSANVSWSLAEIGASASTHTHSVKINGATKTIAASSGAAVDLGNYLPLSGGTMIGSIILKGSTSPDMTYGGNVHPYIRFDNANSDQNVSLIFTDYDSYRSPAGIKLIGNQGGEWFEVPNIYATNFYGNEFKKNGSSNDYVLLGGGGHKTVSSIITSGYIGTTLVLTSSKAQALQGISSINGCLSITAGNDLTRLGFGGVHAVVFGEPGYAHRNYYFRPSYGTPGVTYTKVYIQNASASASPTWTTTHIFDFNGDAIHSGSVTSSGFKKNGSDNSYVLLGGGGHKLISDFATSGHKHDNYLVKTTYDYHNEISFGQSGKCCLGKFPMYDSCVTIDIAYTTSGAYFGKLVIGTLNINSSRGGVWTARVFGDDSGVITSGLSIRYASGSNLFLVYFNCGGWGKFAAKIHCCALAGTPSDICTLITSIPTDNLIRIIRAHDNPFNFLSAEAHIGYNGAYSDPLPGVDVNFKFGGTLGCTGITSSGNITASNFYSSSDIRFKNNINNISKSIRSFNWKESGLKSYGLIAQEIENEYPELVSNNDNGYKSINYTSALCMLVAKLENTVDTLKDRIELLEQQLKMYHGNSK